MLRVGRRLLPELPPASRCKLCLAPSGRALARLARLLGRRRGRPAGPLCRRCLARGRTGMRARGVDSLRRRARLDGSRGAPFRKGAGG